MSAAEEIRAVLSQHRHPGVLLTIFGEAWLACSCDERIDVPVRDGKVSGAEAADLFETHLADVLAPLVTAGRAEAWDEGFDAGEKDVYNHEQDGYRDDTPCIPNPYRRTDQTGAPDGTQ